MIWPEAWGIHLGYHDIGGGWCPAGAPTVEAILNAMEAEPGDPPSPPITTAWRDRPPVDLPPGRLILENGGEVPVNGALPPDLPTGYHQLVPDEAPPQTLVLSPGRVPLPGRKEWGFAAQLYAVRSGRSWGIGDIADLRRLAAWSASLGAGMVMVNPLHASSPAWPQEASPYFAGSRCFVNPIYLAVDEVPGGHDVPPEVADLNRERIIDRDRVWSLKSAALEARFRVFTGDQSFDEFQAERAPVLGTFATYCALAERHGTHWPVWPSELQSPTSPAVAEFARSEVGRTRIRYHAWLQWLLDQQLARAAATLGTVMDLAVGVDPAGADAWMWQDAYAPGMKVGAPPDDFATQGQDWALAPFDPWKLRAARYQPWIEALRAAFRHGAGLRVDHVMGLFRLYWIPDGMAPAEGAYVGYPSEDLLNILALEADRAGAFVAGEDLGTVEDRVRSELYDRGVLSYRVWWFEPNRPEHWPAQALGAASTHDLPTVAGVLSGSDLEAQRRLGLQPNEEGSARLRARLLDWTGSDGDVKPGEVIRRVYADLGQAPCLVMAASLEDVLAVEERPNMPGTVDEWPNWCLALPAALEDIERSPLASDMAIQLGRDS